MCANYIPVSRAARLLEFFGVQYAHDRPEGDLFPMGLAPFIRRVDATEGAPARPVKFAEDGIFRFVPAFIANVEWAISRDVSRDPLHEVPHVVGLPAAQRSAARRAAAH